MRSLERWLHQHIFKVGWLLTKNLQTTTILYYTFFLPGVFLHEVIVWLMAGVLNIRATGEFKFPDKQEIAELKLTFVKYDTKKIGAFRLFVINLMPLVGGIVFIWFAVTQVLQTDLLIRFFSGDATVMLGDALDRLVRTPDFLLWMYLLFTVSATMTPDPSYLRGWRLILPPLAFILLGLIALGIVGRVLTNVLVPLMSWANLISGVFVAVIGVHLFMTAVLGAIESIIERITGDSATFEKGKLIAMRRDEILKMRAEQAEKARKSAARQQRQQQTAVSGPPSIYKIQLPIPGGPDKEGTLIGESLGQAALPGLDGEPLLGAHTEKPAALPAATASTPAAEPRPAAAPRPAASVSGSSPSTSSAAKPGEQQADTPKPAPARSPSGIETTPMFGASRPSAATETGAPVAKTEPKASDEATGEPVKSAEKKLADEKPLSAKPLESKPAETKAVEPKATDTAPVNRKPEAEIPHAEKASSDAPATPAISSVTKSIEKPADVATPARSEASKSTSETKPAPFGTPAASGGPSGASPFAPSRSPMNTPPRPAFSPAPKPTPTRPSRDEDEEEDLEDEIPDEFADLYDEDDEADEVSDEEEIDNDEEVEDEPPRRSSVTGAGISSRTSLPSRPGSSMSGTGNRPRTNAMFADDDDEPDEEEDDDDLDSLR